MTTPLPPVVIIIGPTAAGKTAVACALMDELPQPVMLISADSAMVYRGMDIGTAKPDAQHLARYPHQLIDIRDPTEPYTAADFVRDADACVRRARAAGRVAVIVGGTMLYVKRFVEGIAPLPEAQPRLRAELAARFEREGGAALHAELAVLDPAAARGIHANNRQRLLRALEVVMLSGRQSLSAQWSRQRTVQQRLGGPVLQVGLMPLDRNRLHGLIETRFQQMLRDGFEAEAQALYARGDLHPELPAMRAVGYRQAWRYFSGQLDYAGFCADTLTATRRLAKRQMTWMRTWPGLQQLDSPLGPADVSRLARQISGLVNAATLE